MVSLPRGTSDTGMMPLILLAPDAEKKKKPRRMPCSSERMLKTSGFDSSRETDPEETEAISVIRGMEAAHGRGMERVMVLRDCRRLVSAYEERSADLSWGTLTLAPKMLALASRFAGFIFQFLSRLYNFEAHALATLGARSPAMSFFGPVKAAELVNSALSFSLIIWFTLLKVSGEVDFFTEYGEGNRYKIEEVIGKGSYGVVCSAYDTHLGEKVAIKKINDIFEHVSDATRILREIKLLRLLRHPDIVDIKHILLPPSRREFKDIYVVFELMESDLHQVIKANDDLTPEHYQFFLYQMLRGLKYIHTANVFHRDLKPKNILANADCKLKICDFGLARVAFNDTPTAIFWTDYVATRWYRAPELCGSFFSKVCIPFYSLVYFV
ncbi:hypothetical protein GIB67_006829 [Kingdonia uniflora]|uniref:Protein kinase domain-containing protein n=1 Tax=Kingdonia uniflora TaxID=39325 RepID=A0A7J7L017_9MAGN|nr:hypothetical protein GIB67_006829 [Kingdonia uniflora]